MCSLVSRDIDFLINLEKIENCVAIITKKIFYKKVNK